jgi:hypothetical protein
MIPFLALEMRQAESAIENIREKCRGTGGTNSITRERASVP